MLKLDNTAEGAHSKQDNKRHRSHLNDLALSLSLSLVRESVVLEIGRLVLEIGRLFKRQTWSHCRTYTSVTVHNIRHLQVTARACAIIPLVSCGTI